MRLPSESQLSMEQREVCFAPTTGTMLVTGPPGSGKTVVAIFRRQALQRQGKDVDALVYNNVLTRYTNTDETFERWVKSWWRKCTGRSFPTRREDGSRYHPLDFGAALHDIERYEADIRMKGHWGHLIIDEAQDFGPDVHAFLSAVRYRVFRDLPERERPSLTILADENQRITASNSTIREIGECHLLSRSETYQLTQNYRNTREIARLAASFYTGLPTGVPLEPQRRGDTPRLRVTRDLDDAVSKIAAYARLHENEEIGVLLLFDRTRRRFFNKLRSRLGGTNITVQTYSSSDRRNNPASALRFDKPGVVSVLCYASSKGLEFDTVFLPELQSLPVEAASEDRAKMSLYVMVSRARSHVELMLSEQERSADIWRLLPQDPSVLEVN